MITQHDDDHVCPRQCWHGWLRVERVLTQREELTEGDIFNHLEWHNRMGIRTPVRRCPCDGTGFIEGESNDLKRR